MANSINRRRFVLKSVGASLALPGLPSLMAETAKKNPAILSTKGAGVGAKRFVAVGNLLGFQQNQLFPETEGKAYEETTLLKPLKANREHMTVYLSLIHI